MVRVDLQSQRHLPAETLSLKELSNIKVALTLSGEIYSAVQYVSVIWSRQEEKEALCVRQVLRQIKAGGTIKEKSLLTAS